MKRLEDVHKFNCKQKGRAEQNLPLVMVLASSVAPVRQIVP
jgi:hypothetical protein